MTPWYTQIPQTALTKLERELLSISNARHTTLTELRYQILRLKRVDNTLNLNLTLALDELLETIKGAP